MGWGLGALVMKCPVSYQHEMFLPGRGRSVNPHVAEHLLLLWGAEWDSRSYQVGLGEGLAILGEGKRKKERERKKEEDEEKEKNPFQREEMKERQGVPGRSSPRPQGSCPSCCHRRGSGP